MYSLSQRTDQKIYIPISRAVLRLRTKRIREMVEESREVKRVKGFAVCAVDPAKYDESRRGTRIGVEMPHYAYGRLTSVGETCEGKEECNFFIPCEKGRWIGAVYALPKNVKEEPFLLDAVSSGLDFVCIATAKGEVGEMRCYNFANDRPEMREERELLINSLFACVNYGDCETYRNVIRNMIDKKLIEMDHYILY